jgi:hypothetical protein
LAGAGEIRFIDEERACRVAVRHFWRKRQSKRAYTAEQIDILAAYVVPADAWYIIPVCVAVFPVQGQRGLRRLKRYLGDKMSVGPQMVVVLKAFVERRVSLCPSVLAWPRLAP